MPVTMHAVSGWPPETRSIWHVREMRRSPISTEGKAENACALLQLWRYVMSFGQAIRQVCRQTANSSKRVAESRGLPASASLIRDSQSATDLHWRSHTKHGLLRTAVAKSGDTIPTWMEARDSRLFDG